MYCHLCGESFQRPNIFISHLLYNHGISKNYTCFVDSCSRMFYGRDAYKRHLILNHQNEGSSSRYFGESTTLEPISSHLEEEEILHIDVSENATKADEKTELTDLNSFCHLLQFSADSLISSLYNMLTLNRSVVNQIITLFSDFLSSGFIKIIQNNLKSMKLNLHDVTEMLNYLKSSLKRFKSEYMTLKYFEKNENLINPVPFFIGTSPDTNRANGETSLDLKKRYGYFIPMRRLLVKFLEIPGVYQVMSEFRKKTLFESQNDTDSITNIMQGEIWQQYLETVGTKNVFPIILYFDDFETSNPLGSHAGIYKQGAIYFSIPSLPPEFYTRLENIFLVMLFHSSDRVVFGNRKIFHILVKELQFLENTGIDIMVNGKQERVYFSLVVFTGDNLGLHSIFGLSESFSANYYCRFCKGHKNSLKQSYMESDNELRKENEYATSLAQMSYGIKEECVFHELPNFHIYRNLTCDIMHDLSEGVHRYAMAKIITGLIAKDYFTLNHLNERIKYFNYCTMEKNKPPFLKLENLKNGCLILSSAEMMCLVLNFRLIVGDLVPEHDIIWNYYIIMLEITEILISSSFSKSSIELLKTLIEEHNHLYITIFSEDLKPKFHFLLHYPRVIKKVGPPCYIQSIRFEAKHKDFKTNSHVVSSRKNISLTLALRIQLKLCHRLLSQMGLSDNIQMGPPYDISRDELRLISFEFSEFYGIKWYELNGLRYNNNSVLIYDVVYNIPQFCKITHIIVSLTNIFFVTNVLFTKGFHSHFMSYEVECISENQKLFEFSYFKNNTPTSVHTLSSGRNYVSISRSS